jgi:ATP-dependent helicase/nuclease subunit A
VSRPVLPPDQEARDRILEEFDTTMLVEAAAGTGKTTSLVGRMTALVASGRCRVDTLAAVTFTRKAAAELRGRFTAALEERAREAEGEERELLGAAVSRAGRCFIGTIHSLCARLLRERPVEAGVDVSFVDLDEDADALLRKEAWEEFVAGLFAADPPDPALERLAELGLEIGQLEETFLRFADYPDVEEWPAGDPGLEGLQELRKALQDYLVHIRTLLPFRDDKGTDRLMGHYERIERTARHRNLSQAAALMDLLELFDTRHGAVQKCWCGGAARAKPEIERWDAFREEFVAPYLKRWREIRYAAVIPVLQAAVDLYDSLRQERGALNYQDLLMKAGRLLRDRPPVRAYFRRRFTHLLVDEFQDTDPLQAEVALYLTADDVRERDWRRCRPAPGSLFMVGDPKQSIYRFRRADIATYQMVKGIIVEAGGSVVTLETNFRTLPSLVEWSNSIFDDAFPAEADLYSPSAHRMLPGRDDSPGADSAGRRVLTVPDEGSTNEKAALYDSELIARFIRKALDEEGAAPGDFLVVTWRKDRLHLYADALQRLGVPHRVTGGSAWAQVEELKLLALCLRAVVERENPVALVAVLRGELFGIDDAELYAFRRAGGRFSFTAPVPAEGLEPETAARFKQAYGRLRRSARWLRVMSPVAALERMAADLGLLLRALLSPGGDDRSGTIGKAFAVLREAQRGLHSGAEVADFFDEIITEQREFDGLPARAAGENLVRVMNLHKVKGLEAPVVFLADPGGRTRQGPGMHIDRTGGLTTGRITVRAKSGPYSWKTLAQPPGWEASAAEEENFDAAEKIRLLYVAATRAGDMISVTRRTKRNGDNPWRFFDAYLQEAEELEDPGHREAPSTGEMTIGEEEVREAREGIAARWERSAAATFAMSAARDVAVSAAELHRPAAGAGERGTEWGKVVHFLLETAMREPERDLTDLTRSALEEQGLDPGLGERALETLAAVRGSKLWERASLAEERLVEVPFEICLEPDDPILAGREDLPIVLRGVVDLAFREPGGWVIADWKTDADAAARRDTLTEHHRGQIELYASIWERITGEPVVERGIFFVSSGEYVKISSRGRHLEEVL